MILQVTQALEVKAINQGQCFFILFITLTPSTTLQSKSMSIEI